jgi:hypothetical protein
LAAVLSQRYQQSTHDKQGRDRNEIPRWIEGTDDTPQWITETFVPRLKNPDPEGALGKLLRALLNSRGLKDPYTDKNLGVGSGRTISFPQNLSQTSRDGRRKIAPT